MTARDTATLVTRFLIFLAIASFALAADTQPGKASDNAGAELKALQQEQVKVLTQLVEALTTQYKSGTVGVADVCSAENELCNALFDLTDVADERFAVLAKQVERASGFLKIVQGRYESGTVIYSDVSRAKSLNLGIKIKLLRERSRNSPATPETAGKRT